MERCQSSGTQISQPLDWRTLSPLLGKQQSSSSDTGQVSGQNFLVFHASDETESRSVSSMERNNKHQGTVARESCWAWKRDKLVNEAFIEAPIEAVTVENDIEDHYTEEHCGNY